MERLADALGMWRGLPSDGLRVDTRNCVPFVALAREYTSLVTEAARAALGCGRSERVIGFLERAALLHPLDESLQAQLMLALAASGQQALALAHYDTVRDRLRAELGIDPGEEIRRAHRRILRQDVPAAGAHLRRTPSPYDAAEAGTAVPEDDPAPVRPAQLPADISAFVGREAEMARAYELVRAGGARGGATVVAAVSGTAGVGKTTFAVHWAHGVAEHFPDGQLYLNLRGFDRSHDVVPPAEALRTLLYAVGASAPSIPEPLDARAGLYRSLLAGKGCSSCWTTRGTPSRSGRCCRPPRAVW